MENHATSSILAKTSLAIIKCTPHKLLSYELLSNSYESACNLDKDVQSFDTRLQSHTSQVIRSIAEGGVENGAISLNSLNDLTEYLLDMNREVANAILNHESEIKRDKKFSELVDVFFDSCSHTLKFCSAVEKCIGRAHDSLFHVLVALQILEVEVVEEGFRGNKKYARAIEELKKFKAAAAPFTTEFIQDFNSVYTELVCTLDKLAPLRKKFNNKLKRIRRGRMISGIIFGSILASVLIFSIVAAAVATPPLVAAISAATAFPLAPMGKWADSLMKEYYKNVLKGKGGILNPMHEGIKLTIMDLDNIRDLVDRLGLRMESLLYVAHSAIQNKQAVKVGLVEIKSKMELFGKNVQELTTRTDACSREIRKVRAQVVRRSPRIPT